MQQVHGNVFTRPDTMFGVCEAIGRDLGFHPNILRIALAVPLIWNPLLMGGIYVALGLLVLASRLIAPEPRVAQPAAEAAAEPAATAASTNEPAREDLPLAA